jgi:hypothetical protein
LNVVQDQICSTAPKICWRILKIINSDEWQPGTPSLC